MRIKSFETHNENKTSYPVKCLYFLSRFTTGEAKDSIRGFLNVQSDDAYTKAKAKLQNRYGNQFTLASRYKSKIRAWPVIKPGDSRGLRAYADFLEHCRAAYDDMGNLQGLDDYHENSIMLQKLPKYLIDRWRRVVDE